MIICELGLTFLYSANGMHVGENRHLKMFLLERSSIFISNPIFCKAIKNDRNTSN